MCAYLSVCFWERGRDSRLRVNCVKHLSRALKSLMVSHGSTKGHKRIEIQKFIIHMSWRKYTAASGATRVGQGRVQREHWQDLGHMPLSGSSVGVFWSSCARVGPIQTERSSLVSILGILSKVFIRGKPKEGLGKNA